MRLLDTTSLRLHSFSNSNIPDYAILSHRWISGEEISFGNLRDCRMVEDDLAGPIEEEEDLFPTLRDLREYRTKRLKSRKGWDKIERFCQKARDLDCKWGWCDTVCIDKSSSAELQEAINSMFKWYAKASRCLVYLQDVTSASSTDPTAARTQFQSSEWFTRGWTLQELLAPSVGGMMFLNCNWDKIGDETDLVFDVSSITNIPREVLLQTNDTVRRIAISRCSVSQRMSWAANRQVTKEEDMAYSLLGLFNVNMPMLYGEGKVKAFERLQLEIIKESTDETIFAWTAHSSPPGSIMNVLASTPLDFSRSGSFTRDSSLNLSNEQRGSTLQATQRGIILEAVLIDRSEKSYVPKSLLDSKAWITQYALPLLSIANDAGDENPRKTVFLQLHALNQGEYVRERDLLLSELNWSILTWRKKPERVCIRSGKSFEFFE